MGKIMVNNTSAYFVKLVLIESFSCLFPSFIHLFSGNTAQWFDQPGECPQQTLWQQFDHLLKSGLL